LQSHDLPSFVFSLDLLPEEIFGTEEVPEYILSDSSTEEEDATSERGRTINCVVASGI
jgi:hypothetical protein